VKGFMLPADANDRPPAPRAASRSRCCGWPPRPRRCTCAAPLPAPAAGAEPDPPHRCIGGIALGVRHRHAASSRRRAA
jgi:hypothetical protein